jgi:tetratricopeptide (TPR) repeat protein
MHSLLALVLALLPQLVDKTNQPLPPPPAADLGPEKRADIFMARKMYREAVEAYQQALKATPKSFMLYNKLGIAYHQQLQLDTAQRHYERAVKLNRRYSEAINNIGTIQYARGRYRSAISQYKKALKISPNSASIHSNLGTAYFARKKYKDASLHYLTALKLDPEIFEHRSSVGSILQERSVQDRARFHYYMAKTYAAAGYFERALLYLRKALEEGFRDRDKILEEAEFTAMRETPEFQELMAANVPVIQR